MIRLVYPVPVDNWEVFQPFVSRFTETYRRYKPRIPHVLNAVVFGKYPVEEVWRLFEGLPVMLSRYDGGGMDIGAAQAIARSAHPDDFQVNFTSRAYFHRDLWLEELFTARYGYGQGIYAMSASHEGGRFHLCTRGYATDSGTFARYPTEIVSRDQGVFFECGDGCFSAWAKDLGFPQRVVTFSGVYPAEKAFDDPNGFRQGDQSSVLTWDRHTDIYRDADPETKASLQSLMLGKA
jgi:hypothetical protein